ncbi:MAG: right-handed parallel beta-helix repeat-containing protein [Verrucomicrobiales bacterium]|nr:right-handed parallel beta-helix repeat-containing protein [Verrucomicrobiales bacterium]
MTVLPAPSSRRLVDILWCELICVLVLRCSSPAIAEPDSLLPPWWNRRAPALTPPAGLTVRVETPAQLLAAAETAAPGTTVLLEDGEYRLPRPLVLSRLERVTLRSASGDPTKVVLRGKGWDSRDPHDDLIHIGQCRFITLADLTFTDCHSYAVKVEAEHGPQDIQVYHCHFRDIGTRAIKGSAGQDPAVRAKGGSVRHCEFSNTKVPPRDWQSDGDYIAAIDMMALEDWTFADNLFRDIRGHNGGGRAAIFLWVRTRNVVVERNLIIHCDRGIALGNPGLSTANRPGESTVYVSGAVVRNNMIAGGPDCGIELWHAEGVKILNNSIWRPPQNWARGIRVGTGTQGTLIANNLIHGEIRVEGGEASLQNNLAGRIQEFWLAPDAGNLALRPGASAGAIDRGTPFSEVDEDIRRRRRNGTPDLGAWEE